MKEREKQVSFGVILLSMILGLAAAKYGRTVIDALTLDQDEAQRLQQIYEDRCPDPLVLQLEPLTQADAHEQAADPNWQPRFRCVRE